MLLTPLRPKVVSPSHYSWPRRAATALCCLAAALACNSSFAQSGGDPDDQPVVVLADGLMTGSPTLLDDGTILPPGETLLPGDILLEGALINLQSVSKIVMIEGQITVVVPGMIVFAGGQHCACKCGPAEMPGGWIVQTENSPNCAEWGVLAGKVGRPCIHPVTFELLTYTACAAADTVFNPP